MRVHHPHNKIRFFATLPGRRTRDPHAKTAFDPSEKIVFALVSGPILVPVETYKGFSIGTYIYGVLCSSSE